MRYKIFTLILLSLISIKINAQIDEEDCISGIFVERMPTYKGGDEALIKYLKTTAIIPYSIKDKNIQGRIFVDFKIDTAGNVNDVKILKSLYPELDSIALKIIREMPSWIPATQKGKPVAIRYRLPIYFNNDGIKETPTPSKYWSKKGKKQFNKVARSEYNLTQEEIACWYNFIVWNYNKYKLKDIDIKEMLKSQNCKN